MDKTQLLTLATEIVKPAYDGMGYDAIAVALNAATAPVPNPAPQPQRTVPITYEQLLGALDAADVLKLHLNNVAGPLEAAINEGNYVRAKSVYRGLATTLTTASKAAVQALLAQTDSTEPDPSWPATVPGPSIATQLGLPVVTSRDVQAALHLEA